MHIAYFVTPHGYGHAARACAVINAIRQLDCQVEFDIYTTIPEWFFKDSLQDIHYSYNPLMVDVGFIQTSPLAIDLLATISRLQMFVPFDSDMTGDLTRRLRKNKTKWIFCDISPLGIHLAKGLNIPSLLIENFTWDWIYEDYLDMEAGFQNIIQYYSDIYRQADFHIQTRPFCLPQSGSALISDPVSRKPRSSRESIRSRLRINQQDRLIMITMGGIPLDYNFLKHSSKATGVYYVVPGLDATADLPGNIIPLPHHSDFYHPDLVEGSDAIVGKVGYSTLAEVFNAGKPFGYIPRKGFKESPVLEEFINANMSGIKIEEDLFFHGNWQEKTIQLLDLPLGPKRHCIGADQIASFFINLTRNV